MLIINNIVPGISPNKIPSRNAKIKPANTVSNCALKILAIKKIKLLLNMTVI